MQPLFWKNTMKKIFGLIGAGGYGREVMPVVRAMLYDEIRSGETELVFVVEGAPIPEKVNGYSLITLGDFYKLSGAKCFNVAIANSRVRERIANDCMDHLIGPFSLIAENVVIMDCNEIGDGAILSPFVTITSNSVIGKFFHANIYSYVAHDCFIGNYVTFAPGVRCNGNVVIGDYAYIGTNAVIKPGSAGKPLYVGEGAVIGMGAIVTKDVQPYTTVVGNPARPLEK